MFHPTRLDLGFVKIVQVDMGSDVRFGSNLQVGRTNVVIKKQGFGQQHADGCRNVRPIAIIDDSDLQDNDLVNRGGAVTQC